MEVLNFNPHVDSDTAEIVRREAYYRWEQAGRPLGRDNEFWFAAERQIFGCAVGEMLGVDKIPLPCHVLGPCCDDTRLLDEPTRVTSLTVEQLITERYIHGGYLWTLSYIPYGNYGLFRDHGHRIMYPLQPNGSAEVILHEIHTTKPKQLPSLQELLNYKIVPDNHDNPCFYNGCHWQLEENAMVGYSLKKDGKVVGRYDYRAGVLERIHEDIKGGRPCP